MTSDLPGTPEAAAPAKPPRRRATRKAAAPAPLDVEQAAAVATPDTEAVAAAQPVTDAASTPEQAVGAFEGTGASAPAEDEPAPRATRSRRASTAGTTAAPKRATRSRAKAPAADDAAPAAEPPAAVEDPAAVAPEHAAPALDVLAELGRRAATPEPEPAAADAETEDAETEDAETEDAETEDAGTAPDAVDADGAAAPGPVDDVGSDEPVGGPRLASSAVLFQPPEPTATRPRRRRVVAPAGPPQFVVPEVVVPAEPERPAPAPAEPAADAAEAPAEPGRRRSRRATRTTAAPPPVLEPSPAPEDEAAATSAPAADETGDGPAQTAPSRRGSRRRAARSERVEEPLDATAEPDEDTDATAASAEGVPADLHGPAEPAQPAEGDEPADGDGDDTDEDDDATAGAPRRRRRRGGRGRRSRSGGDDEGQRPSGDAADAAEVTAEDDEDEDEDAVGSDAEDSGDTGEGEEAGGSSRRRRRRRRSGRGGDASAPDVETEAAPARARTPRPPSDEVTALRGSTRLEAKRQRRREGRDAGRRRQIITESEFLARRESVDRTMVVREVDGRTQIAVLEDGVLVEHYVSRQAQMSMAGNVYLGRVQNVLPSMEAAFVDVGKGRNAVLYAGEVNWDAAGLEGQPRRIEQALKSGDSVLVQVTKDPIGHKGARLTSQITLAGRYLVYVPSGGMTGISRKLPDNERARLKKLLREIVPDTAGVIVRTAAEGASEEELRADIARLQEQWAAIEKKAKTASAPALLQGEPDLAIRVVRDIFNDDFSSLVVQGDEAWQTISGYIGALAPDLAEKVTRWTGEGDVFAAHRVDEQLVKGMDRKVWLPSGGSLVIDRTEAMTVVDVNTGKFTGSGGTLEETVTRNNLEAAEEIVRQLRLRDIGGIIVIDFIDMVLELNRDLVLRRLVECLGRDRTKHQVAEVTSLGLVQMTRKRVGQGLVEAFSETCEHCNGRGFIVHTDPTERAAGQSQPQTPQPPVGGDAGARGARRKRGGAKEQGPAVPSGLPMVPVLPQAREAVKATLATIAAAAAHAHEHDHDHDHDGGGPQASAPAAAAVPAAAPVEQGHARSADDGSVHAQPVHAQPVHAQPVHAQPAEAEPGAPGSPGSGASVHPDAVAAVTEALAALGMPLPTREADLAPTGAVAAPVSDAPSGAGAVTGTEEATEGAPTPAKAAEILTDGALPEDAPGEDAPGEDAPGEDAPDVSAPSSAAPSAAVADDATLELVPIGPEVFDLGSEDTDAEVEESDTDFWPEEPHADGLPGAGDPGTDAAGSARTARAEDVPADAGAEADPDRR